MARGGRSRSPMRTPDRLWGASCFWCDPARCRRPNRPELVASFPVPHWNDTARLRHAGEEHYWGLGIDEPGTYDVSLQALPGDCRFEVTDRAGETIVPADEPGKAAKRLRLKLDEGQYLVRAYGHGDTNDPDRAYRLRVTPVGAGL
jgi:hypothetical protein